jgi:hypothetical protein
MRAMFYGWKRRIEVCYCLAEAVGVDVTGEVDSW